MNVERDVEMNAIFSYFFGVCVGILLMAFIYPPTDFKPLWYSSLDNDYHDCMSWHHGTGYVILNSKGKYNLTCQDGHNPKDHKHPYKKSSPLIRGE